MNTFGTLFRITTWGESHGKAIGVVLDEYSEMKEKIWSDIIQPVIRENKGIFLFHSEISSTKGIEPQHFLCS